VQEVGAMAFIVRWLHVTAASFLFGGALLIFVLLQLSKRREAGDHRLLGDLMRAYEWCAWASLGLMVATGVGNLAHFGDGLPEPHSEWGKELTYKLALVLIFIVFSGVRTMAVLTAFATETATVTTRTLNSLRSLYGATAVFVAGIVGMAVALAHF
jgi:uncharacterized membrane protein